MAGKTDTTVWVKNNGSTPIQVRSGDIEKIFAMERVNRTTGETESRGYTALLKSEMDALLAGSKILKSFVDNKTLVIFTEAPEEAFSDAQRVVLLETKITDLETKLAEATSGKELKKAGEKITALETKIAELEEALVASNKALEDYKKEFPAEVGDKE